MRRGIMVAWLLGSLGALPLFAGEPDRSGTSASRSTDGQPDPIPEIPVSLGLVGAEPLAAEEPVVPVPLPGPVPESPLGGVPETVTPSPGLLPAGDGASHPDPWHTVWGIVGIQVIPDGAKIAPNGQEYHPNFALDLDLNFWLWRSQGLYVFADMSLWGEKSEYGVTNGRDGFWGTSKREYDLTGGAAWNYWGSFEARAFGYTYNNLNRGTTLVDPIGFADGFGLENRYYLSPEYAKLGQTGFDVAKATFVSIGYYPSKTMVGNDGKEFDPGLMLRAYLTYDLWNWPVYLFGDATYIGESSCQPKLLLFDLGIAARPFRAVKQFEIRTGVDGTADLQERDCLSQWYVSFRCIF